MYLKVRWFKILKMTSKLTKSFGVTSKIVNERIDINWKLWEIEQIVPHFLQMSNGMTADITTSSFVFY